MREQDRYRLGDAVFGLWISWRGPGGAAVPMKAIGDEAEARVAETLAAMGFDLVYQSRASRGAFDLLAIRGGAQLGVQVKHTRLPASLPLPAWQRMEAEAKRLGWAWVVAVVTPEAAAGHGGTTKGGQVLLLDPAQVPRRGGARLRQEAALGNLLSWLDDRRATRGRS